MEHFTYSTTVNDSSWKQSPRLKVHGTGEVMQVRRAQFTIRINISRMFETICTPRYFLTPTRVGKNVSGNRNLKISDCSDSFYLIHENATPTTQTPMHNAPMSPTPSHGMHRNHHHPLRPCLRENVKCYLTMECEPCI